MAEKRRRRPFDDWFDDDLFGDLFGDFDFEKMNERMKKVWDRMLKDPDVKTFGPYVYGFTYKVGPEGQPVFEEFGNVPGMKGTGVAGMHEKGIMEPITDLNEDMEKVYVTYELPGVSKEEIDLKVSRNNITLGVKEGARKKYYKSIDFDYNLKPESTSAKFVNGLLDVTIEREKAGGVEGKSISID